MSVAGESIATVETMPVSEDSPAPGRLARTLAFAAATCLLFASGASTVSLGSPVRVETTVFVPPANAAAPFDQPRGLTMPAGWRAEVWARVDDARYALWTPAHTLLVASTGSGDVLELVPQSNPAAPPSVRVLAAGLTNPQGLAFDTLGKQRVLYVAESDQVDRYVWRSNGTLGTRTVVVSHLPDEDTSGDDVHRLKGIAVGRDHSFYVTVGSSSNANGNDTTMSPPRGAVYEFSSSGKNRRVFATGVRNGEGLAFAPDGTLWTAVNERDNVPYPFHQAYGGQSDAYGHVIQSYVNENPPDEIARLTAGRNLGWPFCNPTADLHLGNPAAGLAFSKPRFVRDIQNNADGSKLDCSKLTPIDRPIPAHSAPVSLTFLAGSTLASTWRGGALVGAHGSWNRDPPRPPAVLFLPWNSKTRTLGTATPLISGFQIPNGQRWGRPVDAVPGPAGTLYVTDDQAGAVYRITTR
jgi:glucose/arabinose dehydrogenase